MNDTYGTTAYFTNQSDAQHAADDLRAKGMHVDVRSKDSHGESFWDSIKNFFTGHKDDSEYDRYSTGAVLIVDNADPALLETIVVQHNGTMSGSSGYGSGMTGGYPGSATAATVGETDYGSTATSAGIAGSAGANAGTTTGDVDYAGGMHDDMERAATTPRSASARNRDLAEADLADDDTTL